MTSHMDSLESVRDAVGEVRRLSGRIPADRLPTKDALEELRSALDRATALYDQYELAAGEGGV